MKRSWKLIFIFLAVIAGYHILHTFFLYGLNLGSPFMVSALKDVFWMILMGYMIFVGRKYFGDFWKQWKWMLVILFCLIIWGVMLSWTQGISMKMILVGLKYDVYPLILLLSGIFIGYMMMKKKREWNLKKILNYLYYMIVFIVLGGLIRQIAKIVFPDVFYWIGYGPVGDYVLGMHPPLYYRTGPGGWMRLQGLFSGPNNYGYFLVAFFAFVVKSVKTVKTVKSVKSVFCKLCRMSKLRELRDIFFLILYLVSLIWTFSRGAMVGVGVQVFLLIWFFRKSWRKYLGWIFGVGIVMMIVLSIWKWDSTVLHFQAWGEGMSAFLHHPGGYGLGSAGPAVHREGVYLPENYYLQILLDLGWLGFILRVCVLGSIFYQLRKKIRRGTLSYKNISTWDFESQILFLFVLGFGGLLVEGLFLHVFEDSMVNYLFLVSFGMVVGNFLQEKLAK